MRDWWRRQFGPNLPLWVAFWVWFAVTAGVIGRVIAVPPERGSVVPIYLVAGERWLAGSPLYAAIPDLDVYRNPPGVAALFAPLSVLGPKPAAVLWRLACLALYALGIHRLLKHVLPPLGNWRRCGVWAAAVVFMIPALNNGQTNLIVTAAAVLGVVAAARGRWWEASAWLAVCGYFKLYSFAIGLLVVVQFTRAVGWRFTVATLALFALPFVLQNPGYVYDSHLQFRDALTADDRTAADHSRAPRDWTIIPYDITGVPVARVVSLAVSLVAAAAFVWVVWKSRQQPPASVLTPLSLGLIWITLFGPSAEVNTYSVLAPVVAAFAFGLPRKDRLMAWLAWAGCAALLAVEIRAGVNGRSEFDLSWLQPLGAAAVMWGVIRWGKSENRGCQPAGHSISGTGGI